MLKQNIKTTEDLFEYFAQYMCDGDKIVCEEDENEVRTFKLLSSCGFILMVFNENEKEVKYPEEYYS